jgi:hypothetical protein
LYAAIDLADADDAADVDDDDKDSYVDVVDDEVIVADGGDVVVPAVSPLARDSDADNDVDIDGC